MRIRFVDGFLIRNTLYPDFGSVHYHGDEVSNFFKLWFIPEGEVWIDHIYKKSGESDWLLKVDADIAEYYKKDPDGSREFAKILCEKGPVPDFYKRKETKDGVTVAYVDGAIIRRYFDPEFVSGGHDLVYDYVPKNEIWVDSWLDEREYPYVLLHEETERDLMKEGKAYDIAHEYALVAEKEARVKDGFGKYPGYENYAWRGKSNEEITKKYYTDGNEKESGSLKVKTFEQSENFCGPASLRILLSYFGKDVSEEQLAQAAVSTKAVNGNTRGTGTEHEGMIAAAKSVGGYVFTKEGGSLEELEYFIKEEKLPVIVGWFDEDDDHYSVVVNATDKGIIMVDPAANVPERWIDRILFPKIWFDFVGSEDKTVSWGWYMVVTFEKKKFKVEGGQYF